MHEWRQSEGKFPQHWLQLVSLVTHELVTSFQSFMCYKFMSEFEFPKNPDPSKMTILRTRTPAIQVQTLPLEGPRILRVDGFGPFRVNSSGECKRGLNKFPTVHGIPYKSTPPACRCWGVASLVIPNIIQGSLTSKLLTIWKVEKHMKSKEMKQSQKNEDAIARKSEDRRFTRAKC